jgi:AraC-like DNA-binding protein
MARDRSEVVRIMAESSIRTEVRPMTARANSLTERATAPVRRAEREWSMPAAEARTFIKAFECLGYAADELLASAGVPTADATDPDGRVPCEYLGRIVSSAQQQRFTPNLAMELARVTPLGAYPLIDYLVVTSESVGAGVRQLARYYRLIGNPVVLDLHEDADPIRIEMAGGAAFGVEFTATLLVLHMRSETDGRFAADSVSVGHKPDDAAAWERVLGCPVESMARWTGVSIPRTSWLLPLRRRDSVLRQVLEARADDVLARLPARAGLALQVQRALASSVPGSDTRIDVLARRLAMSGRTLQRRLAVEQVSYHELLDDARKEAAARYLDESTLAICEIAYLVGYAEPAPFHRAFKRWYGTTPEQFRQQQRRAR